MLLPSQPWRPIMRNKAASSVSHKEMRCAIFLSALLGTSVLAAAPEFKGATEVLRQAAQDSPKPKQKTKDPYEPFREKLKAFQVQSTNLPTPQAAAQWIGLVD